jgi:hypothetical protein
MKTLSIMAAFALLISSQAFAGNHLKQNPNNKKQQKASVQQTAKPAPAVTPAATTSPATAGTAQPAKKSGSMAMRPL